MRITSFFLTPVRAFCLVSLDLCCSSYGIKAPEGVTLQSLLERGLEILAATEHNNSKPAEHKRLTALLRFQIAWTQYSEPEKAVKNFEDAIRMQREGGHMGEVAASLDGLGGHYNRRALDAKKQNDDVAAERFFALARSCHDDAIEIRRGPGEHATYSLDLAQSLCSLGKLCGDLNDTCLAVVTLKQSLELYGITMGPFHAKNFTVMKMLAAIYQADGRDNLALPLLARCRHIKQTANPNSNAAATARAAYDSAVERTSALHVRPWLRSANSDDLMRPLACVRDSRRMQELNSSAAAFCQRVFDRNLDSWLLPMVGGNRAATSTVLDAALRDIFPELTFFVGSTNEPDGSLGDNAHILQAQVLASMRCVVMLVAGDGSKDSNLAKFAKEVLISPEEVHRLLVMLAVSSLGRLEGFALDAGVVTNETDGFTEPTPCAEMLESERLQIPSLVRMNDSERRLIITSLSFHRSFRAYCTGESTAWSLSTYLRAAEVLGDEFGIMLLHDALIAYGSELQSDANLPDVQRNVAPGSTSQNVCDCLLTLLMLNRGPKPRNSGIMARSDAEEHNTQWTRCWEAYSCYLDLASEEHRNGESDEDEENNDSESDDDDDHHSIVDRLVRMTGTGSQKGSRRQLSEALQLLDDADRKILMVEMSIGVTTPEDGGEIPVMIKGASDILMGVRAHALASGSSIPEALLQGLVALSSLYRQSRHELREIRDQDLRNRIASPWRVNCYNAAKIAATGGAPALAALQYSLINIGSVGAYVAVHSKGSVGNNEYIGDDEQVGDGIEPHVQMMLDLPEAVDLRKASPDERKNLVMFSDTGETNDQELALVLSRSLSFINSAVEGGPDGGLIDLKLVVGSSTARSTLAKGTLDVLGMSATEVGVGTLKTAKNDADAEKFSRLVEKTGFMYLPKEPQTDFLQATLKQYVGAAPKSITMLLLCALTDAAKFIESHEDMFAEKTKRVVMLGGVDETSFLQAGTEGFLEPDMAAAKFKENEAAAALVMRTCQERGVQMVIMTRFATGAASVDAFIFDELAATGHPVAMRMKDNQADTLETLWRKVAHPNGPQGLPARCNRAWFADLFCGGSPDIATVSSEGPIWPHIRAITFFDSVALLCVHDLLLNTFFEPQKRTVRGVQHLIIGLNSGHHGIKEIRNLQNFLMDAWRNSLVLSVEDAAPYRRERDRVVSKEGAPSKDPEQAAGEDSQESSAGEQVRPPKATQNGVAKSNMQRLAEAKEAMELGLISVEEYETKKAEIMAQM